MKEVILNPVPFVRYTNDCQGLSVEIPLNRSESIVIEEEYFFTVTSFQRLFEYYLGYTNVKQLNPKSLPKNSIKFILKLHKILEVKECPNLKLFLEKSLVNSKYILNTPEQVVQRSFLGHRDYDYRKLLRKTYPKQPLSGYWSYNRPFIDFFFSCFGERVKREIENIVRVESFTVRKYCYKLPKYKDWNIFRVLKSRIFYETDKGKVIKLNFKERIKEFLDFIKEVSNLRRYINDGNKLKNI